MKIEIVDGIEIKITKKKNVKNLYIRVTSDAEVKVSAPKRYSYEKIKLFVMKNIDSIKNARDKRLKLKKEYVDGEIFKIFGEEYILKIVEDTKNKIEVSDGKIYMHLKEVASEKTREKVLDDYIRKILMEKIREIYPEVENMMGVFANEYRIKKMNTKWGTCNITDKRICINLKLAEKDANCLRYIIVHELTHLLETNHSKRFYEIVKKYYPNYREMDLILNKN